ncbi:MAG: hypothetical protein ACOX9C_04285 [Kiritimatiellia bacterium]|jgi:hypothetical protein
MTDASAQLDLEEMPTPQEPVVKMRAGQRRLFRLVDRCRMLAFVARRQYGKTTSFANIAVKKMMKRRDHTVIFGSAKLNLSREIVRKEAQVMERGIAEAMRRIEAGRFVVADSETGKTPDRLGHDDFAELFEAQRMEFRYFHSRTSYSRTKVVALRPDTVGETGDLMADEIGRINNWREVWEAIEPIVASDPNFRLLLSTTPPPDDSHYSFEQLAPLPGTVFEVNPEGNVYESIHGVTVLRVDALDADADGVPVYDLKTGRPITPKELLDQAIDKDACRRNYFCHFVTGGSAALSHLAIAEAQTLGARLGCVYAEDDLPDGYERLFTGGPVGIGGDPATTEGEKSNPFGICVTERVDGMWVARLILSFKSKDPQRPKDILRELATTLKPEALALDATSERYWCAEVKHELELLTNVILVVNSETIEHLNEPMRMKTYLGNLACNAVDDRAAALPPAREVKEDFRLVKREKGGFNNSLDSVTGRHGDLFDGFKLSIYALETGGAATEATGVSVSPLPPARSSLGRMKMTPEEDELDKDAPPAYR